MLLEQTEQHAIRADITWNYDYGALLVCFLNSGRTEEERGRSTAGVLYGTPPQKTKDCGGVVMDWNCGAGVRMAKFARTSRGAVYNSM